LTTPAIPALYLNVFSVQAAEYVCWGGDGRQLYIPPDDNWISRSGLTRSQVNDN
jgi:hypothetical protein